MESNVSEIALYKRVGFPRLEEHTRRHWIRIQSLQLHIGEDRPNVVGLVSPKIARIAMIREAGRSRRDEDRPAGLQDPLHVRDRHAPVANVLEHLCGYHRIERPLAETRDEIAGLADDVHAGTRRYVNAEIDPRHHPLNDGSH